VPIHSEVLLLIFLPGLIFNDAFGLNVHLFGASIWQCMTLAFPMVLAGTGEMPVIASSQKRNHNGVFGSLVLLFYYNLTLLTNPLIFPAFYTVLTALVGYYVLYSHTIGGEIDLLLIVPSFSSRQFALPNHFSAHNVLAFFTSPAST
jgi:hypothetical protein